jgi:dihydropteroate synthase
MIRINCKGRLLSSESPVVMGILNITPDSFYTRGRENSLQEHIANAGKRLEEGATLLDIGGLSTRPGAVEITEHEEIDRVTPVIEAIKQHYPDAFLSIDTYRSAVAAQAIESGADMVNDISAGTLDSQMIPMVGQWNVPYIAMHIQGRPQTMQQNPAYQNVTFEVMEYFIAKIKECSEAGIKDLILDPGFGFGKTLAHNFELLKHMDTFQLLGYPLLAGLSRKSMIYKLLGTDAARALNGTSALNMLALQQKAAILRVHDVKEAVECVQLFSFYQTI